MRRTALPFLLVILAGCSRATGPVKVTMKDLKAIVEDAAKSPEQRAVEEERRAFAAQQQAEKDFAERVAADVKEGRPAPRPPVRPAEEKAGELPQQRPDGGKRKAAFNAKDAHETLAWMVRETEPFRETLSTNNAAAVQHAKDQLKQKLDALKGVQVEWPMPLWGVTSQGANHFIGLSIISKDDRTTSILVLRSDNNEVSPKSIPAPEADWALKAKKGDTVVARGVIADVVWRLAPDGTNTYYVAMPTADLRPVGTGPRAIK
jgi:hypothetical protein